jgi:(p)ppGpp synthase/HD superfamily hydrolase
MAFTPRVDREAERSEVVREALATAREAHAGQSRDTGSGEMPFIEHPLRVAERLAEEGFGEEVLAAGLLHDVLEHSDLEPAAVRKRVGEHVTSLVEALSEDDSIERYEHRKQEHRERVSGAGREAMAVFAADKLANVEVLRDAYAEKGEEVDAELPVSLDTKIGVWEQDLEMLFQASPDRTLVDRFASQMAGLWRDRAAAMRVSR